MVVFRKVRDSLRSINYRLFAALLVMGLIPIVYTTVRIFFLGQMPDSYAFSIASQLQWVNLLYEIIQEALILPLYFFIGKAFLDNQQAELVEDDEKSKLVSKNNELANMVRTGLIIVFGVYTLLSIVIITCAEPLIRLMAQDVSIIAETASYIRLEALSNIFSTLIKFIIVVLVTIKKEKYLYFILGTQMVLTLLLDMFFISNLSVSIKLGVNGIAITNIIVNALLLILAVIILKKEDIFVFSKEKLSFDWVKGWTKVGGVSGIESFVRNLVFMVMIVRMCNIVGEQGAFWVANNFIWGWMLLPIIQLGELIKRDCGENKYKAIQDNSLGYFALTTIIVVLWFALLPAYKPFMSSVLQLADADKVYDIVLLSIGFYVLFAYNNVIDSIFYGIGRTDLMLYQSLAVNVVYYGCAFILYLTGVYVPTLTGIALMFALGTGIDSVLTYFIFGYELKEHKLKLL